MKLVIILIPLFLLIGCTTHDIHDYYKEGKIIEIDKDVIFGNSFTDWRHDLHFDDGTVLWLEHDSDLSLIRLNETGYYHFKTNFFTYEGTGYKFYNLISVKYNDLEL